MKPRTLDERIKNVSDRFFLREPLLLLVVSSHQVAANSEIKTIRAGKGRIEYNPDYLSALDDIALECAIKAEAIRILLRHPYRYPPRNAAVSYIASNLVLNENYKGLGLKHQVSDFWSDAGYNRQSFEFYYRELLKLAEKSGGAPQSGGQNAGDAVSDGQNAQNAELWQENEFFDLQITHIIENMQPNSWGSLKGDLQSLIMALLKPDVDYRAVLSGFRASVLSQERVLTRFRPSRRYGFLYMGKKSRFTTQLLVGVDVSASCSDAEVQKFYSTINWFFKYGIERIHAVAFDTEIQGEPLELTKARKQFAFKGRGGTSFEPIVDFFARNSGIYDGLIIFTDGDASIPKVEKQLRRYIVWVCNNKRSYDKHHAWMESRGRCCYIR
ncbi:MAG: VWA-like domain-containing protein [Clostridiales bacterium]|jgi:predicted metal-dependent peptidase|nr:VWA-like domain-containing protein [Clostridiales bacterium]